jgi:hypothetical protein
VVVNCKVEGLLEACGRVPAHRRHARLDYVVCVCAAEYGRLEDMAESMGVDDGAESDNSRGSSCLLWQLCVSSDDDEKQE